MALRKACHRLHPKVAEGQRAETSCMLKYDLLLKSNITKEEAGAFKELKGTDPGSYFQWRRGGNGGLRQRGMHK